MADELSLIETAHLAADAARDAIRPFFRSDFDLDNKLENGFDPVTSADRAAEIAMRDLITAKRPGDGIIGEEFGIQKGSSGYDWILDPIDGTRAFICGAPTWGVLIGIVKDGWPVYGLIDQPYTQERFEGGFGRCQLASPHGLRSLGVRPAKRLKHAKLMTTFPEIGTHQQRTAFDAVAQNAQLVRYGMDCYAYALLAAGQINLVIEAGLSNYDVAGPIAVIEAAGGFVRNWDGTKDQLGGEIIAASSLELLNEALSLMAPVLEASKNT